MKKLQAWILSLALLLAMVLPASAGEVRDLPVISSLLDYAEEESYPYWDGYEAGYDAGYQEGFAQGEAPGALEYRENPYEYVYSDLTTYEEGYANGLFSGYDDGYTEGWQSNKPYYQQYEIGYEAGYEKGTQDGRSWYPDESKLDSVDWDWYMDTVEPQNGTLGYDNGYKNGYYYGCSNGFWAAKVEELDRLAQRTREEAIIEAGGALDQINVMVNGKCLAFPDAAPQLKANRTMVPLRGVMEALGAKVDYQDGKITITWNETEMTTTVGTKLVSVTREGDTTPVTLDSPSYVEGNRTYVPLRFLSEAAGYDVLWDSDYQTAVLLDRKAVVKDLNADFQTLNLLLAARKAGMENAYRSTTDLTAKAEIIDTIDGNKTAAISGRGVTQTKGMTMNMTGELDLSQLWDMLESSAPILQIPQETVAQWKTEFSKVTLAMKVNEDGEYYIQCPLLVKTFLPYRAAQIDPNAWILIAQADSTRLEGNLTVGDLLYDTMLTQSMDTPYYLEPFGLYNAMQQAQAQAKTLVGDATFTRSGTSYQWSFGLEELANCLEMDGESRAELEGILRQFAVSFSFQTNGSYEISGEVKVGVPGLGALLKAAFQESGSPTGSTGSGLLQLRNLLNVTVTTTTKRQKTSQAPDTSLPQGAQVVNGMMGLF